MFTQEYKGVEIQFDPKAGLEKPYSIDRHDFKGEYKTETEAKKAVRIYIGDEEEQGGPSVDVLVLVSGFRHFTYVPARTKFTRQESSYSYGKVWVSYKQKRGGYGTKQREGILISELVLDTPENRAMLDSLVIEVNKTYTKIKEMEKEMDEKIASVKRCEMPSA